MIQANWPGPAWATECPAVKVEHCPRDAVGVKEGSDWGTASLGSVCEQRHRPLCRKSLKQADRLSENSSAELNSEFPVVLSPFCSCRCDGIAYKNNRFILGASRSGNPGADFFFVARRALALILQLSVHLPILHGQTGTLPLNRPKNRGA